MNQSHPNVKHLLALDPVNIRNFDRDTIIRHLGWSDHFNAE